MVKRAILILIFLGIPAGIWFLADRYHMDPMALVKKGIQKAGLGNDTINQALSAAPTYPDYQMDGWPRHEHPRILMPELATWDGRGKPAVMEQRQNEWDAHWKADKSFRIYHACYQNDLLGDTACWLNGGRNNPAAGVQAGINALAQLRRQVIQVPSPENPRNYGDAWYFALSYDLLALHPDFTEADHKMARSKLRAATQAYLQQLEDDSASLWHGRATLAANAWLSAIMLDPDKRSDYQLMRKAQAHFMATLRSLSLSEGWPEGYNYWINDRALPLTLAAAAYINGLDNAANTEAVRQLIERTGLWHVYLTRPDHRVEGVGDEASRIDLKDDTRRVIDLMAQLTRNPALAAFSDYVSAIHHNHNYYFSHQPQFTLFNDPTVPFTPRPIPKSLKGLGATLKDAELFGKGAMNQLLIHNGWGKDSTFISFTAGASMVHHGHYDAGHFTLFKRQPLATNSGTYGEYTSPHRLNYSIRTVAKNSLLILRPDEEVSGNGRLKENISDGGQRITMPTGSAIMSVEDWMAKKNAGPHLEGGRMDGFSQMKGQYVYANADLTRAYNSTYYDDNGEGGKVSRVQRELLYLTDEDTLIIHDRVNSTQPGYTKKWLLHSINKPEVMGTHVLKGDSSAGILESDSAHALIQNDDAYLQVTRLYPQDAKMRLIGGEGYRYYVEADGDDSDLDGINMVKGERPAPWYDAAAWRIEIQPSLPRKQDNFLVVLTPGLDVPPLASVQPLDLGTDQARGLNTGESLVIFVDGQLSKLIVTPDSARNVYLAGLPPHSLVSIQTPDNTQQQLSDEAGLLQFALPENNGHSFTIIW